MRELYSLIFILFYFVFGITNAQKPLTNLAYHRLDSLDNYKSSKEEIIGNVQEMEIENRLIFFHHKYRDSIYLSRDIKERYVFDGFQNLVKKYTLLDRGYFLDEENIYDDQNRLLFHKEYRPNYECENYKPIRPNGYITYEEKYTYDDLGNLVTLYKKNTYSKDFIIYKRNTYNHLNQLIKEDFYNNHIDLSILGYTGCREYVQCRGDGSREYDSEYLHYYDTTGNKIKSELFIDNSQMYDSVPQTKSDTDDYSSLFRHWKTINYDYDSKNRLIESVTDEFFSRRYSSYPEPRKYETKYVYSNNIAVQRTNAQYYAKGRRSTRLLTYKLDQKRVTEETVFNMSEINQKKYPKRILYMLFHHSDGSFTKKDYDENGEVTSIRSYDKYKNLVEFKQMEGMHEKFMHKYDDKGNWVSRVGYNTQGLEFENICRKITYFND